MNWLGPLVHIILFPGPRLKEQPRSGTAVLEEKREQGELLHRHDVGHSLAYFHCQSKFHGHTQFQRGREMQSNQRPRKRVSVNSPNSVNRELVTELGQAHPSPNSGADALSTMNLCLQGYFPQTFTMTNNNIMCFFFQGWLFLKSLRSYPQGIEHSWWKQWHHVRLSRGEIWIWRTFPEIIPSRHSSLLPGTLLPWMISLWAIWFWTL